METLTRRDDNPEVAARIVHARRRGRKRTIMYSVLTSGITTLLLVWALETQLTNSSIDKVRENCRAVQAVTRALEEVALDVARRAETPRIAARWNGYAATFRAAFPPAIETCEDVFPKRSFVPLVESE